MRLRATLILALAATLLTVPAAAAQTVSVYPKYAADGLYDIGLTGVSALLVDQAQGQLFISDGTRLTVASLAGSVTATKTLPASADAMVMSDDGSEVFALQQLTPSMSSGTVAVTRIDAPGLTVTPGDSSLAGAIPNATSIAYSAGLVWVLSEPASGNSVLYAVDPSTLTVTGTFDAGAVVDRIVADPGVPGELYAWQSNPQYLNSHYLYRIDVTGPTTPAASLGTSTHFANAVAAVDVAPDGSEVVVSAGYLEELAPSTLSTLSALDQGATGGVQVRGSDDVVAYASGSATPLFYFPDTNYYGSAPTYLSGLKVVGGTLGFGATQLYWIAQGTISGTTGTSYRLGITTPAHSSGVTISVRKNDNWRFKASVPVKAKLTKIASADLAGKTVEIYGQKLGGSPVLLGSGPTDATGLFSMSFRVTEYTDLIAVFPGDDTYAPAASSSTWVKCRVKIKSKAIRTKRHSGKYALYQYSKPAIAKMHVSPNHSGGKLFFYWQYYQNGWHTAGSTQHVLLSPKSNGYYLLKGDTSVVGKKFRIIGWFKGDGRNDAMRSKPVYIRFTY